MSPSQIEEISKFLKISDSIATSGQPTEAQFQAIKASGFQVVVNLALPQSTNAITNEKEMVESCGMQYVHIPIVWENPTLEDFASFSSVMEANSDRPVFVHCAANMRVSAFMYLYRRIHEGINDEEAKRDLERIWHPNETWQEFILGVIKHYQHPNCANNS